MTNPENINSKKNVTQTRDKITIYYPTSEREDTRQQQILYNLNKMCRAGKDVERNRAKQTQKKKKKKRQL